MRVKPPPRVALISLGALWTLPNTLLGLLAGLVLLPFGARLHFAEGSLAFKRVPKVRGAVVLGCVILRGGEDLDTVAPSYAARCGAAPRTQCARICDHERAHVRQYLLFGPLFLPVYFLCGGVSARSPFERAADRCALTGTGWHPFPR